MDNKLTVCDRKNTLQMSGGPSSFSEFCYHNGHAWRIVAVQVDEHCMVHHHRAALDLKSSWCRLTRSGSFALAFSPPNGQKLFISEELLRIVGSRARPKKPETEEEKATTF